MKIKSRLSCSNKQRLVNIRNYICLHWIWFQMSWMAWTVVADTKKRSELIVLYIEFGLQCKLKVSTVLQHCGLRHARPESPFFPWTLVWSPPHVTLSSDSESSTGWRVTTMTAVSAHSSVSLLVALIFITLRHILLLFSFFLFIFFIFLNIFFCQPLLFCNLDCNYFTLNHDTIPWFYVLRWEGMGR